MDCPDILALSLEEAESLLHKAGISAVYKTITRSPKRLDGQGETRVIQVKRCGLNEVEIVYVFIGTDSI